MAAKAVNKNEQVFKKNELETWDRENVAGGKGMFSGKFSFTRNNAKPEYTIKEIGWMTLLPGDFLGVHAHTDNEDSYIVISGVGEFTDNDGVVTKIEAGDITITRAGQSHAIKNIGEEPLIFLDIVAKDSEAKK
ncbi:MAG: cupin domain-containing protein [Fusobacteriaceae bacterium]|jgi:mannose-6-phosphate isomerase-like protein (cupin superfamily)|nr:cupin domain-containing protein [Fusobacteriaceae bacterium]